MLLRKVRRFEVSLDVFIDRFLLISEERGARLGVSGAHFPVY